MARLHNLRAGRVLAMAAIAAAVALVASCISAQERDYVKYDAGKDEFHMLMVLTDIRATDQDDLDYLAALYNNRDNWLAPAVPGGADTMAMAGWTILRAGEGTFTPLNIFASRPTTMETLPTAAKLSSVTVLPGTFFVEGGKVGYYQGMTVPGAVIDAGLKEFSKSLTDTDLPTAIDAELKRRADGGATATWAQLKEQTLQNISIETATATTDPASKIDPAMVMSAESLKAVEAAAKAGTLAFKRDKTVVALTLPLTAQDSAGMADLWQAMIAKTAQVVKDAKATPENQEKIDQSKGVVKAGQLIKVVAAPAGGLTLSLDLLTFAPGMGKGDVARVDLNDKDNSAGATAPDVAAFLKEKGIPLDTTLTAAAIARDFDAGTLKAHPSATPVKPGEGIVKPAG